MYNTNVTAARNNLYKLVDMAIDTGEIVNIHSKKGSAFIISGDDYGALIETLYLSSNPNVKKSIIDGLKIPFSNCVPSEKVIW